MPEPVQTTIYGAEEPLTLLTGARDNPDGSRTPAIARNAAGETFYVDREQAGRLFTAPQTIRGQLAIPTEKEEP